LALLIVWMKTVALRTGIEYYRRAVRFRAEMEQFDVTREQIAAVLAFVAQSLKTPVPALDSAPADAHSF
jgi:hypothetical protein